MAHVDIGWPWGLVVVALNAYSFGTGYWLRKALICSALGLHGLRMGLGALVLFGQQTGWRYRFDRDLPRYEYARHRWEEEGMPLAHWWVKIQHDTLQQMCANIGVLPAPIILASMNPDPVISPVEWLGLGIWLVAWCLESTADAQKMLFMHQCKSRTDVLGHKPWDGSAFGLWTLSRHPNYFFEWCCWCGFVIVGLASLVDTPRRRVPMATEIQLAFLLIHLSVVRFFYDCLLYWTGAEPAEYFSVLKRPAFREYQANTRCFFPFEVPGFDHHRVPGWPAAGPQP